MISTLVTYAKWMVIVAIDTTTLELAFRRLSILILLPRSGGIESKINPSLHVTIKTMSVETGTQLTYMLYTVDV